MAVRRAAAPSLRQSAAFGCRRPPQVGGFGLPPQGGDVPPVPGEGVQPPPEGGCQPPAGGGVPLPVGGVQPPPAGGWGKPPPDASRDVRDPYYSFSILLGLILLGLPEKELRGDSEHSQKPGPASLTSSIRRRPASAPDRRDHLVHRRVIVCEDRSP